MRFLYAFGVLLLGISAGAIISLFTAAPVQSNAKYPLLRDHVRLIGELYAHGESLSISKARLEALGAGNELALVASVAGRSDIKATGTDQDLAAALVALAPAASPTATAPSRAIASGRGEVPTPAASAAAASTPTSAATALPSATTVSRVVTRMEALLRTGPDQKSEVVGILPTGATLSVTRMVQGAAVQNGEARWFLVEYDNMTGYVYYGVLEPFN